MSPSDHGSKTEKFVALLTENQRRMFGYVFSLVGDHSRASDILQETNLVLWRKLVEYDFDRPFLPWALAVARNQVLASIRNNQRDRLLLDESLVLAISEEASQAVTSDDRMQSALAGCMQLLSSSNQQLITQRYQKNQKIAEVARITNRSEGAVRTALVRIRQQLLECVDRRLRGDIA